jgi:hypothetical protein
MPRRPAQSPFIRLGILPLQGALLVNRWHRNPGIDRADNLGPLILANSIRGAKPAVQVPPKRNVLFNRRGLANGTKGNDMLGANPAAAIGARRRASIRLRYLTLKLRALCWVLRRPHAGRLSRAEGW